MGRADYQADRQQFLSDTPDAIIGSLITNAGFDVDLTQRNAWLVIIAHLKTVVGAIEDAYVLLEFTIPRMGRRVDAVVLSLGCVFVLEYKVGSKHFHQADLDQVIGYALDLKNFHEPSHSLPIFPILIATKADPQSIQFQMSEDRVCGEICSRGDNLADIIERASKDFGTQPINPYTWVEGRYKPTPTIIEAAQALYRNHQVADITRNEAGAENLLGTADYISSVIDQAKRDQRKAICFITGVPGSGKTLAGLNIASLRTMVAEDEYAVFLSGNGPLVKVLRAALVRDETARRGAVRVREANSRGVEQFIQNIHHFRDANLNVELAPIEKVVLFDEAQRAWDRHATSEFMRKKRGGLDFDQSEPEFLLSVMNRHQDWCTVVCLVGNGQEINTGEAGLKEWLSALNRRFPSWQVHVSDRIAEEPDAFGISELPSNMITNDKLHLSTAIRSFRSESVSAFASFVVDGKLKEALALSRKLGEFEFRLTRDLQTARNWLRQHRRGTERAGILAFSNAIRLKPEGIFVKAKIDPEDWFLASRSDIRSSDFLEDVATEFDVQGLELDWACVCIDANLRFTEDRQIEPVLFRGSRWQTVRDPDKRRYILNAHRVLLTRARQGVILFVPNGQTDDHTRDPRWYDDLYNYFVDCGVSKLETTNRQPKPVQS